VKPIRVVKKKLGRERADGQAWKEDRLIEIDPRLKDKEYLLTIIHETLHVVFPEYIEEEIHSRSIEVTAVLWKDGFRRQN